jgi:hypothetical protein
MEFISRFLAVSQHPVGAADLFESLAEHVPMTRLINFPFTFQTNRA